MLEITGGLPAAFNACRKPIFIVYVSLTLESSKFRFPESTKSQKLLLAYSQAPLMLCPGLPRLNFNAFALLAAKLGGPSLADYKTLRNSASDNPD